MEAYKVVIKIGIVDEVAPVLRRMIGQFAKAEEAAARLRAVLGDIGDLRFAGTSRSLAAIDRRLAGLGDRAKVAADGLAAGFDRATAGLTATEARLAALKSELAGIRGEGRAAASTLALGGGRGGGHERSGGSGGHGGRRQGPIGRVLFGHHGGEAGHLLAQGAGLGVLGAIGYGALEAARVQSAAQGIQFAAGKPLLGRNWGLTPASRATMAAIKRVSAQTGVGAEEAGKEVQAVTLSLANLPFKQRLALAPSIARFSYLESRLKNVSPTEAAKSLLGLLHMIGAYTPSAMKKLMGETAAVSRFTTASLGGIEKTASYVLPLAMTAEIPTSTVLSYIAGAQRSGITSSKGGTWIASLIEELNPKAGFASLLTTHAGKLRAAAMERLGLVGPHGQLVGMNLLEHGNLLGLSRLLRVHLATVPKAQRLGELSEALGSQRAARAAALIARRPFSINTELAQEQITSFLASGSKPVINALAKSDPVFAFRRTMANFSNALMALGTTVLPVLTAALNRIDTDLHHLLPELPGGKKKAITATGALKSGQDAMTAGGAVAGFALGGKGGAIIGSGIGYAVGEAMLAGQRQAGREAKAGYFIDPSTGIFMSLQKGAMAPPKPGPAPSFSSGMGSAGHDLLPLVERAWHSVMSAILPAAGAAELPRGAHAALRAAGFGVAAAASKALPGTNLRPGGAAFAGATAIALPRAGLDPAGAALASATALALGGQNYNAVGAAIANAITAALGGATGAGKSGGFGPGGAIGGLTIGGSVSGAAAADLKRRFGGNIGAALAMIAGAESGGRNVLNYRFDPRHTASGYFQITNSTWRQFARAAGVDLSRYPTAISAPFRAQSQVAATLYRARGFSPWSLYDPRLRRMISAHPLGSSPGAPPFASTRHRPAEPAAHERAEDRHGGALEMAMRRALAGTPVTIANAQDLHGDVHLDGEAVGHVLAHHLARGLSRAATTGAPRSGARPDFSGGPVLPPPV